MTGFFVSGIWWGGGWKVYKAQHTHFADMQPSESNTNFDFRWCQYGAVEFLAVFSDLSSVCRKMAFDVAVRFFLFWKSVSYDGYLELINLLGLAGFWSGWRAGVYKTIIYKVNTGGRRIQSGWIIFQWTWLSTQLKLTLARYSPLRKATVGMLKESKARHVWFSLWWKIYCKGR